MIKTSNPFLEGDCHYEELEDGLWILVSDITCKKNISYNLIYDKSLPVEYYTLSLYMNETRRLAPSALINNIVNVDKSWMLHKPGDKAINCHFTGSRSLFFIIYFSQDWLDRNAGNDGIFTSEKLDKWLLSDSGSIYLAKLFNGVNHISEPILKTILNKGKNGVKDLLKLKIQTLELMSAFIEKTSASDSDVKYDVLTNTNRRKILKAEKKLSDAIFKGFPGIENLAHDIGISTTKLKNDFKSAYGHSLFRYFQYRQMEAAKDMLSKDPELKIAYVAGMLGYLNPSKFSATFKKCYGYLPSELNEKQTR
ncbi:AraC family transcriptional regulator [Fulvivirga sp. M361]|uniref:AraC family transcriptional regulator n=1 Tax=Fulvivirga sp. M361 TaxID=2594266 RepID=UPI001628A14F|nr:AraC family transcriptional regulator [Fulvivirga sp. M361]